MKIKHLAEFKKGEKKIEKDGKKREKRENKGKIRPPPTLFNLILLPWNQIRNKRPKLKKKPYLEPLQVFV
jgi:hypothetical protein